MKDKLIKDKTQPGRRGEPPLEIASVEFTPTAGIEKRLTRIFDLLLGPATGKSHVAMEDEAVSGEELED